MEEKATMLSLIRHSSMSLRHKIIIMSCLICLISCGLIGIYAYTRLSSLTIDTAINSLKTQAQLMSLRFKSEYDKLARDVELLSEMPPIQGIIRSSQNNGFDVEGDSSTEVWRSRLEVIFESLIAQRPAYTQIRYIGVADNGKELVRVDRDGDVIKKIKSPDLQSKAMEPYFQQGLAVPKDKVYFSEVTYNREFGKVDASKVPTFRVLVPVYDNAGKVFGMVVINTDYKKLLSSIFDELAPEENYFFINQDGDYIAYTAANHSLKLELHNHYTVEPPEFVEEVIRSPYDSAVLPYDKTVAFYQRAFFDSAGEGEFLDLVVLSSKEKLMQAVYSTRYTTMLISFSVIMFSMLVAAWLASRFTSPLLRMANNIMRARDGYEDLDLPVSLNDEIGEVAQAFYSLANDLSEKESQMRKVFESAADSIITIDDCDVIVNCNAASEELLGYQRDALVGKAIAEIMPGIEKNSTNPLDQYVVYSDVSFHEDKAVTSAGDMLDIEFSVSEAYVKQKHFYTLILRDITERKKIESLKSQFVSTVNHEIRTPLTSIKASLDLLSHKIEDTNDNKVKKLVNIACENCEHLVSLVDDILDMEKIASGKMDYHIESVELVGLVSAIVERYQSYADKQNINLVLSASESDIYVNLDDKRFTQAIVNLLSNAVKFSPSGDEVNVDIEKLSVDQVKISVTDHGEGVPIQFQKKIFDRFSQADGSSSKVQNGTGLGLSITKNIVEALGGSVGFYTAEGQGTTFYVLLKCADMKNEGVS